MTKKFFPIKTETACQLKWSWSTLYLNTGVTKSCHRTAESTLTRENFNNFHNTDVKIADRQAMLAGLWPEENCSYCRQIEERGGFSDRMLHLAIPDLVPPELNEFEDATIVTPTIVEVFFNNTCNLSCLYCGPELSSTISNDYRKHGLFKHGTVNLAPLKTQHYTNLVPKFWEWMQPNSSKLRRLHVLGGEPFFQRELTELLDFVDKTPMPECEINIVTNLMVPDNLLAGYIQRFKVLVASRKIKRLDIACSIDCWGDEQEYVRYGLDLRRWEKNFEYLLSERWINLNINQTISSLTIKSMPALIERLNNWKSVRKVGHYFSGVSPGPAYMQAGIFGPGVFDSDFEKILALMHQDTDEEQTAYNYMQGIANEICTGTENRELITDFFVFINEMDRRRGTNWRNVFPWLREIEKKNVV